MRTLFSIVLNGGRTEFSMCSVPDISKSSIKFWGLCNGGVFVEGTDYEKVRSVLMDAVQLNKSDKEEMN
jgi:hypothetical protein